MEPKVGQIWKHYKGGAYRIVMLAKNNQNDELYDAVVYVDATDPAKVWTQSLERFSSTEQYQGGTVQRFVLVTEDGDMDVKIGQIWRHYKGNHYKILLVGKHSETGEYMTAYQRQEDGKIYFRPLSLFFIPVEWEGKTVPRFAFVSDN